MDQRFDVVVSEVDGSAFIRPIGVLDIRGAADFEHEILATLSRRLTGITIDLNGVTFMDSIGLRSLFRACDWCERRHMALSVLAGSEPVRRLLHVTGAELWLPLVEDLPHSLEEV